MNWTDTNGLAEAFGPVAARCEPAASESVGCCLVALEPGAEAEILAGAGRRPD